MRQPIWDELRRIKEDMDAIFEMSPTFSDRFLISPQHLVELQSKDLKRYRKPLTDIYETDKELIITAEIPGVEKQDIKINITEDSVEFKVEKNSELEKTNKKEGIYQISKNYIGFYKCLPLPPNVNIDKAEASYKNGVLELRIPKIETKKKKSREITVK